MNMLKIIAEGLMEMLAATPATAMNTEPPPPPDDEEEDGDSRRNVVLVLAVVVVIVVLGFLLVWKMWQNEKLQECYATGRRDCAPIEVPDSR